MFDTLLGRPEGKRPLEEFTCRRNFYNIKKELKEMGCDGLRWISVTTVRVQL